MSDKKYQKMSESEKNQEDWMNRKWRPMMGWMYMVVCICDFIIFPVLWGIYHAVLHTGNTTQWQPLTLQGAGLFHLAMGAVLGLAAWGRTQEKLNGVLTNYGYTTSNTSSSFNTTSTNFNNPGSNFNNMPAPTFGSMQPPTITSSMGKSMPIPPADPIL